MTTTPSSANSSSYLGYTSYADAKSRKTSSTSSPNMTTKRCNKCQLVKSTSEFSKNKYVPDGLSYTCKHCHRKRHAEDRQRGLEILQCLAVDKGCCAHCERPYLNEDWHFLSLITLIHDASNLKKRPMQSGFQDILKSSLRELNRICNFFASNATD